MCELDNVLIVRVLGERKVCCGVVGVGSAKMGWDGALVKGWGAWLGGAQDSRLDAEHVVVVIVC